MTNEYHSLMKNDTWDLVPQPQENNMVKCQWVHNIKFTSKALLKDIRIIW
jgi:hypothetical protein